MHINKYFHLTTSEESTEGVLPVDSGVLQFTNKREAVITFLFHHSYDGFTWQPFVEYLCTHTCTYEFHRIVEERKD